MNRCSECTLSDIAPKILSGQASQFKLAFIFAALCATWVAVCGAARADSCADFSAALPSVMAENIDNDRPTPESQYAFALASDAALDQESAAFRRSCKASSHDTIFATAMLSTWLGWVEYFRTVSDAPLTAGIQQLTNCSVRYFGSNEAAICDEWARRAIGWRDRWNEPPP